MKILLQSESLNVEIQTFGAQIVSVKEKTSETEYICPGEKTGLPTILFPNLTAIKDGYILINGNPYPLMHGGFAKSQEFCVAEQTQSSVTLKLRNNLETQKVFPYFFELTVEYQLNDRTLQVHTTVKNTGTKPLHYALGYHPAYLTPAREEPFRMSFEPPLTASRYIREEKLFTTGIQKKYFDELESLPLFESLFKTGTLALTDVTTKWIRIQGEDSGKTVEIEMGDYRNLALFAPSDQPLEYTCVELWDGAPDVADTDHVWETKPELTCLESREKKTDYFSVKFYNARD